MYPSPSLVTPTLTRSLLAPCTAMVPPNSLTSFSQRLKIKASRKSTFPRYYPFPRLSPSSGGLDRRGNSGSC
ncbi:hypothetical protein PanWU01x14_259470 [Parasponia andersonii]|uniref:Uncharacterized protein n=1 Tax=Parasponia andersonii TaxID=3476 RepID=A0A2P5B975_PARAD|nr:hypothetical protein PanWU01x14_259470 [Parasponia andersonii]